MDAHCTVFNGIKFVISRLLVHYSVPPSRLQVAPTNLAARSFRSHSLRAFARGNSFALWLAQPRPVIVIISQRTKSMLLTARNGVVASSLFAASHSSIRPLRNDDDRAHTQNTHTHVYNTHTRYAYTAHMARARNRRRFVLAR